jgi:hypothetical protein
MSKSNNCRLCTGGGEGAKVLYRYSPSDYQIDADCKYSSLEECESINNPRKSYISPAECLVWFNDNGGEVVNNGTYVFQNMYGQSNNVNPIPSTMNGNMAVTDWNTVGQTHSRLWAYDVTGNTLYYVDSFTHEGNDIAVAQNMMFVGCESKDESGADTRNSSIVSYNYQITNNDTTTFTKTPQKTYRFVNHLGYLIRDNGGNASWAQYEKVGLGNSIGGISDSELIIDDHGGSIWYANLDDNWSGTSIYSSDDTDSVWTASNSIDNQGYPYLDLDTYTPDLGDSLGRWKHCTYGTENRIYTIRCKLLVNAGKGSEGTTSGSFVLTQGDIQFNPTDTVLSGDPSFTVTYKTGNDTENCPVNPGFVTDGTDCDYKITKFKFPTDLDNITVQTYADRFVQDASIKEENNTPPGSINLASEVGSGNLYSFSKNYLWSVNSTTLDYSNPIQAEFRLFNSSGIGQMVNWDTTTVSGRMGFRGGGQSTSCVNSSSYSYNCSINGCVSTLGTGGAYMTFSACSADCISYSCQTSCVCITGYTADIGGTGYFGTYIPGTTVGGNLNEYRYKEDSNTAIQSNHLRDTCQWAVPANGGYYGSTQDETYGQGAGGLAFGGVNMLAGSQVEGVSNSGNQQSSWGVDGTRFCLNDDCTTFTDLQGPTSSVGSGFWGATGNYLFEGRLNKVGAFPGSIDTAQMDPIARNVTLNYKADTSHWSYDSDFGPLYKGYGGAGWVGTSKCITVTGTTNKVYYVGVGSSEYYHIGVDGVIQIDTARPQVANRVFNPNTQPNPSSNQDVIDGTGSGNESRLWWMHRFELEPGEHTITVEMFAMGDILNVHQPGDEVVPGAFKYKALGVDIVGPFDVGVYDTTSDITTNFTPQIYTANTLSSTSELSTPTSLPTTCSNGICYLTDCYQGHYLLEPIPYTIFGELIAEYPDPYRVAAGLGGTYGWENPALDPITLPNGGEYLGNNITAPGVPDCRAKETPYYAPKTNGSQTLHPGSTSLPRQLNFMKTGYNVEEPSNMPWWTLVGSININQSSPFGWNGFSTTLGNNPNPCVSDKLGYWNGGDTYQKMGSPLRLSVGNGFVSFGGGVTLSLNNGANINQTVQSPPDTWEAVIDFLNGEGLMVSSVPDPGTSNYPNIDYNATYWQVMYAVADYWTAAFPNGAANGGGQAGKSQITWTGNINDSARFYHTCYDWCDCGLSTHLFDTQPFMCNSLQVNVPTFNGGINGTWNPVTVPNALTNNWTYERDWIYDSCQGACITTTGCTIQNSLGAIGCTEVIGTGYTNNNVFINSADCDAVCGSGSTTGVTYYECSDSGCTTAKTGTITPFTSLTQCTGSCISYNCTTTGCTEFNPPVGQAILAPNAYGTGGTFTDASLCYSACTSYQCGNWGCSQYVGSGGTYLTEALCTGSCISYECLTNGCVGYEGSGYTYTSTTDCQDICVSYECTTNCCELWNAPFYGTGGTFFDYTSSATSLTDCQNECVSWGCNVGLISSDTDIFAYYDTTSMGEQNIIDAFIGISGWTQTLSGWSGNIRHVLANDERWLSWASIPYTGQFTGGTTSVAANSNGNNILQWAYDEGVYDVWWDQTVSGQTTGLFGANGNSILTKGLPDPVGYDSNILNVIFVDESSPQYHPQHAYPNNQTQFFIDPQYSGGVVTFSYQPTGIGTLGFKPDYDGFTATWDNVTGNTGDVKSFIYPSGGAGVLIQQYEVNNWVGIFGNPSFANPGQFALNVVASIDEGNQTDIFGNPSPNGTWISGTAPRPVSLGGTLGGTPALCPVASLTALELPENPYVQEGYGYLARKGWGYNVSFPNFTNQVFQNDLESFLTQGTSINYLASGNTGCISGCTQPTAQLPYSSQTDCQSGSTDCQYFTCTNTGCELATFGTASTFNTLSECEQVCQSFNCGNVSATTVGAGPCEVQTGTGGTFSLEVDCLALCTSYECFGVDATTGPQLWGCQSVGGTGSTFTSYSACSADCKSWECSSPCSGGTNSGCTQYPYTGLTYSSETICNDSCVSTWWCTPENSIDMCSGRTLTSFIVDSGIDGTLGVQTIGESIADFNNGYQFTNLSTIKFEDAYEWNTFGPNGTNLPWHSNTCIGPSGYFVYKINYIESDVLPGGPWFTYNDFIQAAINTGIVVNLAMSWVTVVDAISSFYNAPNMDYTRIVKQRCQCDDFGCGVQCENGLYPTVPSSWTGPYTTSGQAYTTCCANTWDCTEGYEISSCSGKTNINIGIQYSNSVEAANYVTQNYPNVDVSTLYYESDVLVNTLNSPCLGPNGGPLMQLQAFDYATLNNGISYGQWNYFIQDLIGQGLSGVSSGMSYDILSNSLFLMSGTSLDTCVTPCRCLTIECDCIEVEGSGGTYSNEAECLSALTNNTGPCDCGSVTGTSWDCFDDGPYEPTCGTKPNLGLFGTTHDVVDFYRTNLPNQNFIDNRFTNTTGIVGGTLGTYPIPPLTWNQVWGNMSATTYDWMDCYHQFSGFSVTTFRPYKTIWWISHPQLTGGNGVLNLNSGYWEYPTWNDFYGAAAAAGAPVTTLMSYSSACQTLDTFFNPAGLNFQCMTKWEQCCSGDDCYCVQQWGTGGTYTTEVLCEPDCCPVPQSGYTCSGGNCVAAPTSAIPYFPTLNDCNNCVSDPNCQFFLDCNPISWDCESGTTTNSCAESLGPIDTIAPGTVGNQVGVPFTTNPITYPFTSDTLTTTLGLLSPTAQVENTFTNHIYWDASVPYSTATYEINSTTYSSGNITLPTDICIGPNGYPQFRLISIGHMYVNSGLGYNTWESFVSVASGSPYNFNITVLTTPADLVGTLPAGVTNGWNVSIEPCLCTSIDCECVPVIGYPLGQYSSSAMCEQFCCDPLVTYDCTVTGCVDPGNGLGAFTGYNAYNLCVSDCHEWQCNQLVAPDCECVWILGTGNTGTNIYPGTPSGYYSCSTGCCETVVIPQCPILLSVDDNPTTIDSGIYYYDMTTNISQPLFTDPGYTFEDVSYWQTPTVPVGSPDMLVFTYRPNEIKEWYVSSNVTPTLNRTINLGQTIGKGLTNVTQFKLLSAEFGVYEIDLINSTNTTASITTLFTLPGGYKCTGDISFDPSSNLMLVLYDNDGTTGPAAPDYRLGKYNYNGILLDEYIIPSGLLSGGTDKFDGIVCNIGPSQSKYVVSQSGLLFEIIESPTLSIAPLPYSNVSAIFNTGSINNVTGAEGMCGCLIGIPETYDCMEHPPGSTTLMCVDPGTGLGQYTYQTAINGGYASALDECETECTNDCTSWSCVTTTTNTYNTCPTQILMPSSVTSTPMAFDWMSLNGISTSFQDYKFESTSNPSFVSACLGVNGYAIQKTMSIYCTSCLDPAMQQTFYNLGDFILTANGLGIGLSLGQTRSQMQQTLVTHYNITNSGLISISGTYCICVTNSSTSCVEVSGTSGYVTEQECLDDCKAKQPLSNCASVYAIPVCNTGSNTQADPLTQTINCCITVDGLTPTYGLEGSIIEDPATNVIYKISSIDPCRPVMGCSCTDPYNYITSQCGVSNVARGAAPESNRCLSIDCPRGLVWDYNSCSCMSQRGTTVFVGDSPHISVMVSDFMKKGLGEVTSKIAETMQLLEVKAYNCNSDNGNKGNNLFDGCLSKEDEKSRNYRWNSNEQNPLSTFACVDGLCIELGGSSGGFPTLVECIQHCDTIGGDGSRPSFLPPLEKTTGKVICLTDTQPTSIGGSINTVVTNGNGYVCQTTLNTLVGEYQKSCVPQSKSTPTSDDEIYDNLTACLEGCGGWFNCNVNNISVDGISLTTSQAAPVVMCCESYIIKATKPITIQDCNTNCCDGTDTWFPLYNVFGVNKEVQSLLSYTNRRLSSLVNSQICTVSETKTKYVNEGKQPIGSGANVNTCGGNTISYVDNIPCYPTIAEALSDAATRGCTGYHTHMVDNRVCYMACQSHSQSMGSGVSAREMMGGGPCICREYQTGSDGQSTCVKWSPAGCGDSGMIMSNSPTRIDTPNTTQQYNSGGRSMGGGMSSGGGY